MILKEEIETISKDISQAKICISTLIARDEKSGLAEMMDDINKRLKYLFVEENLEVIENLNIDKSCLYHGRQHLSRKSNVYFAMNCVGLFKEVLKGRHPDIFIEI